MSSWTCINKRKFHFISLFIQLYILPFLAMVQKELRIVSRRIWHTKKDFLISWGLLSFVLRFYLTTKVKGDFMKDIFV